MWTDMQNAPDGAIKKPEHFYLSTIYQQEPCRSEHY